MKNKKLILDEYINNCLKQDFGLESFRPLQKETIDAIISGKDVLAVMPTGHGKSLLYQLPARLYRPKLTVVISPLISLMDDQVEKAKGLNATKLHSGQTLEENEKIVRKVAKGEFDLLYVSPERLSSKGLLKAIKERDVGLFVVDEAHCVSVWGHDFRPSYLFIPEARKQLGNPQMALFTATAPPHTREDIIKVLGLKDYELIQGDVVRGNIDFKVSYEHKDKKAGAIERIISSKLENPGSAIIYGTTIEEITDLYDAFSGKWKCSMYHGQMDPKEKEQNQKRFMEDFARVMFCTSAFGMGVDKPNVYTIIHNSLPGSLEQYIQEAGRAGRDGNKSEAILLYDHGDVKIRNTFILMANPPMEFIKKSYDIALDKCKKIAKYQGHPVTYSQLKYWFTNQDTADWVKNRAESALGTLINLGFITQQGDEITFPHGESINIPQQLLEAKAVNDYRRLQMMELYAQSGGNLSNVIKNYFLGATSELVKATEDVELTVNDKILGFIGTYREPKMRTGAVLSGEIVQLKESYKDYFRSLPFVSPEFIGRKLEDLASSEFAFEYKMGASVRYALTEKGANYLNTRGISIKPHPPIKYDITDFRNVEDVKKAVKHWAKHERIDFNNSVLDWKDSYERFLDGTFKIQDKNYCGEELVTYYSGLQEATYASFGQFMEAFLNVKVRQPVVEKSAMSKIHSIFRRKFGENLK